MIRLQGDGVDGRGMRLVMGKSGKLKKLTPEQIAARRRKIWMTIAKKDIPKVSRTIATSDRVREASSVRQS